MIEVNRRKLLTWGGAGLALLAAPKICMPAIAKPTPTPVTESVLSEAERMIIRNLESGGYLGPWQGAWDPAMLMSLNIRLVRALPGIFDPKYIMRGPCDIIGEKIILSVRRETRTHYTLEYVQDLKGVYGLDVENELLDCVVGSLTEDYMRLVSILAQGDSLRSVRPYPYIPALPVRQIDPVSFQPRIGFICRYGWAREAI